MKVVITIPAYNEAKTISMIIEDIKTVMDAEKEDYVISVVDDGSTDKTADIAKKAGAVVYSHPRNYGLAEAFRTEIKQALKLNAGIIVHTDADGQYQAKDIPLLIKEIKNGNDLVLGDRFTGGIESMPLIKKIGNRMFSRVISKIIKHKVHDCQTGFRAFTREFAENIKISSGHTYTQEQIIRCVLQKFKLKEVPIRFLKRKDKSRLISNPLEYALKAMVNILRVYRDFEPLKFFGRIGGAMILMGVIIGTFLVINFIKTDIVEHIPSTILAMLLVVSGLQILLFGFLADMNKE